jgi:hypothetical protein
VKGHYEANFDGLDRQVQELVAEFHAGYFFSFPFLHHTLYMPLTWTHTSPGPLCLDLPLFFMARPAGRQVPALLWIYIWSF